MRLCRPHSDPNSRNAPSYSHRVTLVKTDGKLVAFAYMNAETFALPDAILAWDGVERLTQNAACFEATTLRKDLKRKDQLPGISIAHLGAIACSPFATKGLGSRLLELQRSIAKAMGHASQMLAIEAIKPLDVDYYAAMGFKTTTPTFYPTAFCVSLVPMFSKLSNTVAIDLSSLAHAVPITTKQREDSFCALWPEGDARHAQYTDGHAMLTHVCNYMWQAKDTTLALESLRQIVVRANLTALEASKLWSMRYHSLSYQKPLPLERQPLTTSTEWFAGPKIALSREDAKAIREAYVALAT